VTQEIVYNPKGQVKLTNTVYSCSWWSQVEIFQ